MLTMEEKEKFLNTVREVNSDDRILQEWMIEENAKMAYEDDMYAARKEGIEQGIEQGADEKTIEVIQNMLGENIDYETISKVTGKTIEDIKEIENNNK